MVLEGGYGVGIKGGGKGVGRLGTVSDREMGKRGYVGLFTG